MIIAPSGPGQPESFQEFHGRIQKVREQNRQQQRDHHAGGVIEEQQNDRGGDHAHAEV